MIVCHFLLQIFQFGASLERNTGYFRGSCKALKSRGGHFSSAYICVDFEFLYVLIRVFIGSNFVLHFNCSVSLIIIDIDCQ